GDVQVVGPVEAAERSVQIVVLGDVDPERVVAVGHDADRFRPRVVDAHLESVCEAPVEPRLERVVLAVANRRDQARLAGAAELPALSCTFSTAGWLVRSGRASEYGSFVMPNPARNTVPGVARYVTPSRGANIVLLTLTPRSVGTDPTPPIIIWFVFTSYRSRPRSARAGMGKYSQRVP